MSDSRLKEECLFLEEKKNKKKVEDYILHF